MSSPLSPLVHANGCRVILGVHDGSAVQEYTLTAIDSGGTFPDFTQKRKVSHIILSPLSTFDIRPYNPSLSSPTPFIAPLTHDTIEVRDETDTLVCSDTFAVDETALIFVNEAGFSTKPFFAYTSDDFHKALVVNGSSEDVTLDIDASHSGVVVVNSEQYAFTDLWGPTYLPDDSDLDSFYDFPSFPITNTRTQATGSSSGLFYDRFGRMPVADNLYVIRFRDSLGSVILRSGTTFGTNVRSPNLCFDYYSDAMSTALA